MLRQTFSFKCGQIAKEFVLNILYNVLKEFNVSIFPFERKNFHWRENKEHYNEDKEEYT